MNNEHWHPQTPLLGANWREVLANEKCALVLFGSCDSAPDALQDREIGKIRADFAGKITFFAADLDDEDLKDLIAWSGVMSDPTMVYVCSGEISHRLVGFHRAPRLSEILNSWIPTN